MELRSVMINKGQMNAISWEEPESSEIHISSDIKKHQCYNYQQWALEKFREWKASIRERGLLEVMH